MKRIQFSIMIGVLLIIGLVSNAFTQDIVSEPEIPSMPGITTDDPRPRACVECHRDIPDMGKDFRLTVLLGKWENGADPKYLEKAQAAMPAGKKLSGKHPDIRKIVSTIPTDCLMCHWRESEKAPPFSRMLHLVHLVGGKDNHYLMKYKGECLNCHKLDQRNGHWGLGNGVEN